jgi:hypothetical protein
VAFPAGPSPLSALASTPPPFPSPSFPSPSFPISPSGPQVQATTELNRLLAGEHAAVFAYPLIIARVAGNRRALATALWEAHRQDRDELQVQLVGAGMQPVAAEPAYNVGTAPSNPARAAALAARVERGLAALAADVVAVPRGRDRNIGADQLVLAARRTAGWTGQPIAFPGE